MYNFKENVYGEDLFSKAAGLFYLLEENEKSLYPYPIVDLYISSKVNSNKKVEINVNNLTLEKKIVLANLLYLDVNADNFVERLKRIINFVNRMLPQENDPFNHLLLNNEDYYKIKTNTGLKIVNLLDNIDERKNKSLFSFLRFGEWGEELNFDIGDLVKVDLSQDQEFLNNLKKFDLTFDDIKPDTFEAMFEYIDEDDIDNLDKYIVIEISG